MRSLKIQHFIVAVAVGFLVFSLTSSPEFASADTAWRSGHPPTIVSAIFDDQRRLVVEFTAPDGMAHLNALDKVPPQGGSVVIDNDPVNANPAYVTTYGPLMACNNKGTCKGMWRLPRYAENNSYTFTTEPLSEQEFPAGTYYLQVNTSNEDPYASTRYEEFSNIATVVLKATPSSASLVVPLLLSARLPINSGTPLCTAWRNRLVVGNLIVQVQNTYNAYMNTRLDKLKTITPAVDEIYQRTLKETAAGKAALAKVVELANSACGAAPSAAARNGQFVPVPVPASNGTATCNKNRNHLVYVNQELTKVFNNMRTTTRSQTARDRQLNTRLNQLTADLQKTWPLIFKTCNLF